MKLEFKCENDNIRLSEELKLHMSKHLYRHLKGYNALIYVNDKLTKTFEFVSKGDNILVVINKKTDIDWPLYDGNIDVIYEDINVLIINKRTKLLTIPTKINPHSLYQEVLYYLKDKNEELNISILNRLDYDTSGLLLIAKNPDFAYRLSPTHLHMTRKYHAICHGIFDKKEDKIIIKIKRGDTNKRIISNDGDIAITNYKVLEEYNDLSLVEFILETGRTHQIRLTASYLNHPICGDKMYGIEDDFDRLMLNSYYLSYNDPYNNEFKEFEIRDEFLWKN